jgi:hypothetical protein
MAPMGRSGGKARLAGMVASGPPPTAWKARHAVAGARDASPKAGRGGKAKLAGMVASGPPPTAWKARHAAAGARSR